MIKPTSDFFEILEERVKNELRCPACHSRKFILSNTFLSCESCKTEYGIDENQTCTLFVKHIDLVTLDITPEVGDVFVEVGRHFEVSGVNRLLQPDQALGFQIDGSPFYIVNYVITGYLTRTSKLNLTKYSS